MQHRDNLKSRPESGTLGPETQDSETQDPENLGLNTLRPGALRPKILGSTTKVVVMKVSLPSKYASHFNSSLNHSTVYQ